MVNSHGRFVWYELTTTDMEAAKAFYSKVVGWGTADASTPGMAYTLFIVGPTSIGGLMNLPPAASQIGAKPSWVGYIEVDDVDATVERLKELGGTVHVPPTDIPTISRFSVVSDPEMATFVLVKWRKLRREQRIEPGTPGRVGWHELLAADCEKASAFYGNLLGWQKPDAETDDTNAYHLLSVGGQTIGGMLTKPPALTVPYWLYYFSVRDIDAAAKRVKAGGGEIQNGPIEVSEGHWIVQCTDPQGAMFALVGKRSRNPIGYFERVGSRDLSDPRARRWSW